jgi:hypothetical protein
MTYVRCGVTGRSVLSHFNEVELERKIDRRLRERDVILTHSNSARKIIVVIANV